MAMKYKYLSRALKQNPKWGVAFKFEWRVTYEHNQIGAWVTYSSPVLRNRQEVRQYKVMLPEFVRNIKIQRRLVQVHWQDYKDSFTYSEKGNGNGR